MKGSNEAVLVPYEEINNSINVIQDELDELRLDGVTKKENLHNEITNVRKNKQISKSDKVKIIDANKHEIVLAKRVIRDNKENVSSKVKEMIDVVDSNYANYISEKRAENRGFIADNKAKYKSKIYGFKSSYKEKYKELTDEYKKDLPIYEERYNTAKAELKNADKNAFLEEYNNEKEEAKRNFDIKMEAANSLLREKEKVNNVFKDAVSDATMEYKSTLKNAKLSYEEKLRGGEKVAVPEKELKEYKQKYRDAVKDIRFEYKTNVSDAKVYLNEKLTKAKDEIHKLEVERYGVIEKANNKKLPFWHSIKQKWENYKYNFKLSDFLLKNGLYITIVILFIAAIIYYATKNGTFLFNMSTIFLILTQASPKIFLALGVGGLIVLAGTDLSIGRLVGLASVLTGMMVTTTGTTGVTFFGKSPDFTGMPLGIRVPIALLLSIAACTLITTFAGFFTAKFKMHPFISTLATQLMTFGILAGITGNSFTGSPDDGFKNAFTGNIGSSNLSVMTIWAIIGIAVVWFIWNKTKFGKNMYAVGGNPEAASVSGINVFAVTLGVFAMAGILYGIGGSMYGVYTGNVRAQTGQGMESDAIAACVVGGVSFSGGVGKVSGIVIGALLFQAISVVTQYIGITDANYQLAIKGIIVLVAVTIDCAKYLKKK